MVVGLGRLLMVFKVQSQWPLDVCLDADVSHVTSVAWGKFVMYRPWLAEGRNTHSHVPTRPLYGGQKWMNGYFIPRMFKTCNSGIKIIEKLKKMKAKDREKGWHFQLKPSRLILTSARKKSCDHKFDRKLDKIYMFRRFLTYDVMIIPEWLVLIEKQKVLSVRNDPEASPAAHIERSTNKWSSTKP